MSFNKTVYCVPVSKAEPLLLWRRNPHISTVLAQWMGESCQSTLQNADESVGSAPLHGPADANGYCLRNANWKEQASLK
jgi:hypothetical protein